MKFNYNGEEYDTYDNNRLQVTKDEGLKEALIQAYYGKTDDDFFKDTHEILFQLALTQARYRDIIYAVTGGKFSKPGTYPAWVVPAAKEHYQEWFELFNEDAE